MELYTVVTSGCWNFALLCLLTQLSRTKVGYLYYSFPTSVETWNSCCFSGTLWRHFMLCSLEDLFMTGEVKFLVSAFSLFTLIKTKNFLKLFFYNSKITTILFVWLYFYFLDLLLCLPVKTLCRLLDICFLNGVRWHNSAQCDSHNPGRLKFLSHLLVYFLSCSRPQCIWYVS